VLYYVKYVTHKNLYFILSKIKYLYKVYHIVFYIICYIYKVYKKFNIFLKK